MTEITASIGEPWKVSAPGWKSRYDSRRKVCHENHHIMEMLFAFRAYKIKQNPKKQKNNKFGHSFRGRAAGGKLRFWTSFGD